jgi:hypothetical protein
MTFGVASKALILVTAMAGAASVFGATPKPISIDRSGSSLVDAATAEKLWKDNTSARLLKQYPAAKFRFVSETGGGFNDAKLCVVSARAMLLPVVRLPIQGATVVYAPVKSATAFDAVPNLSSDQCRELARSKLTEAIQSVEAALSAS